MKANVDKFDSADVLLQVVSPSEVALYSGVKGDFKQRDRYIEAKLDVVKIPFGEWMSCEKFNVCVQSCFVDDAENAVTPTSKGLVLKYSANVKTTTEVGFADDGVTQGVTAKTGVTSVQNVALPNPVTLRPYRTFIEVEQPASQFVFRIKQDDEKVISFALFEADGGAWRNEAMQNIKAYFAEHLSDIAVIA